MSVWRLGLLFAAVGHVAKNNRSSELRKITQLNTRVAWQLLAPEQIREANFQTTRTSTLGWVSMGWCSTPQPGDSRVKATSFGDPTRGTECRTIERCCQQQSFRELRVPSSSGSRNNHPVRTIRWSSKNEFSETCTSPTFRELVANSCIFSAIREADGLAWHYAPHISGGCAYFC